MSPFTFAPPVYGGYVGGYAAPGWGFPPIFLAMAMFLMAGQTFVRNVARQDRNVPRRDSVVPNLFGLGGGNQEPEYDEAPCTVAKV